MRTFVRRYPLASYFTLAFAISWGGILAVVRDGSIPAPPLEAQRLFPWVYLVMLGGPSVAGLLLTWVVSGREGLRDFGRRLGTWEVEGRWYLVALLTAPVLLGIVLLVLAPGPWEFVPALVSAGEKDPVGPLGSLDRGTFILMGLAIGIGAGFFEELGWTGFATPVMRRRFTAGTTGLVIGVLWGAWHFLAVYWGSADAFGDVPVSIYLAAALFSFLPPYRVLMVKVYDRTRSLPVAILMHASATSTLLILSPAALAGTAYVVYNAVFALVLWVAVGALAYRQRLVRFS